MNTFHLPILVQCKKHVGGKVLPSNGTKHTRSEKSPPIDVLKGAKQILKRGGVLSKKEILITLISLSF